jgi:hypothetical protein
MSLSMAEPKFMGAGVARQGAALGESINPAMGPSQAVHLIETVIDQKFLDPDFQVTPQEWEDVNRQKFLDKMQARQERVARARTAGSPTGTLSFGPTYSAAKRRQLEESLGRSISSLSLTDGLHLIDRALTKLGI